MVALKSLISPTNTFTEYIDEIEYKNVDKVVKVIFIKCALKMSRSEKSWSFPASPKKTYSWKAALIPFS